MLSFMFFELSSSLDPFFFSQEGFVSRDMAGAPGLVAIPKDTRIFANTLSALDKLASACFDFNDLDIAALIWPRLARSFVIENGATIAATVSANRNACDWLQISMFAFELLDPDRFKSATVGGTPLNRFHTSRSRKGLLRFCAS